MEDKSGGLIQWSVDQTVKWAVKNWQSLGQKSDQSAFNQMRYRHTDVLNDRAQIGTDAHAWIEADLTGQWEMPVVKGEAYECVQQWLKLRENHKVEPRHVEVTAFNRTDGWMGTLDFGGYVDDILTLGDAKTSRAIQHGHKMQIAALSRAEGYLVETEEGTEGASEMVPLKGSDGKKRETWWKEIEAPKYQAFAFFKLRPNEYDPYMSRNIPAYWELDYLDPDEIEFLYDEFVSYRHAWQAKQNQKKLQKQKNELAKVSVDW